MESQTRDLRRRAAAAAGLAMLALALVLRVPAARAEVARTGDEPWYQQPPEAARQRAQALFAQAVDKHLQAPARRRKGAVRAGAGALGQPRHPVEPGAGARGSGRSDMMLAWSHQAYLKASNTDVSDGFGTSVALSADGSILAVGAKLEDSAATGIDGDQADETADGAGAAYVLTRSGLTLEWSQQAYLKASNFGLARSIRLEPRAVGRRLDPGRRRPGRGQRDQQRPAQQLRRGRRRGLRVLELAGSLTNQRCEEER